MFKTSQRKKISSKELTSFYLKEAEANKNLNAYISMNSDMSLNWLKNLIKEF